jgi:hypothetical protein
VERVGAADRGRAAACHHGGDPVGGVRADQLDLGAAGLAEEVEELFQGGLAGAWRGPDQPALVVVDDHGQGPLALLVADLVDPDAAQPLQQVDLGGLLGRDPGTDPSDGPPRHPQQLRHRDACGVGRQPGGGVLEGAGEPGAVPGPGNRRGDHPMLAAAHPGRVGFQQCLDRAEVQRAPAAAPVALVIAWTAALAAATAASAAAGRPHQHHQRIGVLIEQDPLDDGVLDAEQPLPYPCGSHAVSLLPDPALREPEP